MLQGWKENGESMHSSSSELSPHSSMELQRHQSGTHFPLEQWNWSTSQPGASGLPGATETVRRGWRRVRVPVPVLLTCDVGQPEALPRQTVIGVEVDPDVVLGGQVGRRQRGATHPQTVQAPVAADGDPVGGAAVGPLQVKVLETAEEESSSQLEVGPGPGPGPPT